MELLVVTLFLLVLLLLAVGALVYARLRDRLDGAERRLGDIDAELYRLRRGTGTVAGEAADAERERPEVAAPKAARGAAVTAAASAVEQAVEAPPEALVPRPGEGALVGEDPAEPPPLPAAEPTRPEAEAAAPPSPRSKLVQIDWERWIGVRGAAVLGGAVLALAAILFLKFSIERGLIPPIVRVTLGMVAGLCAVGGAEVLRKRAYGATANSLSGAGIVILYASIWAAHRLYDLIPVPVALVLLVLVTVACGLLSWRHRSLVIATLGLVGGFATPFMLASERVNPIGLFGYILMLDAGLLALSRKRGWPLLSHLALVGTLLYQGMWIFGELEADRLLLTLGILAVFAALFAAAGGMRRPADEERRERRFTAVAGVLLPFAFAVYLAARADLGEHILPIAALLLLLSAAACWMARVHGLPLLAPGAAAASVAVVAVWAARTEIIGATIWEAVGVASALALLFYFFDRAEAAAGRAEAGLARGGSALAAAGFLLVLLGSALRSPADHLWPWAAGWLVLSLLLVQRARSAGDGDRLRLIPPLAAGAEVFTLGVWLAQRQAAVPLAWEVAGVAVALAVFYHLLAPELPGEERRLFVVDAARSAAFVAAAGLFFVLALAPLVSPASPIWPWLAGWAVLAGLLVNRGGAAARGYRQVVAAGLFGFCFLLYYLARNQFDAPPRAAVFFGLALAVAIGFQGLALARRSSAAGRQAEAAATLYPWLLLFALMLDVHNAYLPGGFFLAVGLFLAGLVALSATRYPSGAVYLGVVTTLALVHLFWTTVSHRAGPETILTALGIQAAAVLLFTFWPFVAGRRLADSRWALYGSALAGPLWFLSLKRLFELRFGAGAIGLLPLLLAVAALLAALAARRLWAAAATERRRALVWYLAVTFAFVSVAIPLQLDKEWITVGWALEGLALLALWKRLDHPGLKYLGLALLAAVTLRLIVNPAVFGYYPRSGRPIFNWLMYTYLVPAASLLLSARLLAALETARLLGWEERLYGLRRPMGAIGCGLAAILIGFWWINLAVIDYFSVGGSLDLSFERLPARDLSLSLAWALYALILLAVGMARRSVGLRWLSLGFLILTIGKVFLYDLGELKDLYRVASLVGSGRLAAAGLAGLPAVRLRPGPAGGGRDRRRGGGALRRRAAGRAAWAALIAATVALPPASPAASSRPDLRSLFPNRAAIFVDQPGLSRLGLPPEILAQCRPDLADLRIIDRRGREVPYLVDSGPPPDEILEERVVFEPRLLATSRQTERSESAPDLQRETYELEVPTGEGRDWDLVIQTPRPRFVRRFELRAVREGEEPAAIEEGSLFRLPDPLGERLRVAVPGLDADRLVVTFEGQGDFFLEPSFRFEASRVLPEREQLRVDLAVRSRRSRNGRTTVELERPRGLVPDRLAVATATGTFKRRFEVWDEGSGSAAVSLGAATLYRLEGVDGVEKTELSLTAAAGDRLRVVIDDGDSPPLEETVFQAVLRRPSLVFSLGETGSDAAAGHLLYGGGRAYRPRYDVAGLLQAERRQLAGEQARIGVELRDVARLGSARLGPPAANPRWDPSPALAFAMRPGTEIAIWPFGYRRPVAVPETGEGLLRLPLDAETVARSRPDLADLRLVDAESRQWPYLLDRTAAPQRLALEVGEPDSEGGDSTYALHLPAGPLGIEGLLLDGPAPYFDRAFELLGSRGEAGRQPRTLARGRLTRRPEDGGELLIPVGGGPVETLELRVLDGDDPPLEWTAAAARVALPDLFFVAPEGEYTLLFGNPDARRPRYELEQVRDLVLAVDSTRVVAGEVGENPGRGPFARFRGQGGWQQALLWAVLVLAALVLAWLTLRLARQDSASG